MIKWIKLQIKKFKVNFVNCNKCIHDKEFNFGAKSICFKCCDNYYNEYKKKK